MTTLVRSGTFANKLICGFRSTPVTLVSVQATESKPSLPFRDADRLQTIDSLQAALTVQSIRPGLFHSTVASKGINQTSYRYAHTDVRFPNFDDLRPSATLDATTEARETEDERRATPVAVYYGVGGMMAMMVAKEAVQTFVSYKAMAADQRALASIEIKLSDIPEGQTKTFEWRGKPVFVKHRTAEEIQREKSVVLSELRDPQHDDQRVVKDEWSVVVGVCTHLGCVPIAGTGDFGGYYCPCHGSHYDGSGRIRKGPAPLNLQVPEYLFKEDKVVVGVS
ncbi:unnamed protein product [Anisakis simplex]|uniref:Cytochrome b-c1 complex subunit Rieske, mitochondrial n=1 Tax=Anisakis simplex TaxID=6269 RepID=A0A0M3JV87_ANISI|nr:unnamed protein product [Anisakis simplex]